jgi:hypothetical protein
LKENRSEIDTLMHDIHGADIGQLRRDYERLMPNTGDESVTLRIKGAEPSACSPCLRGQRRAGSGNRAEAFLITVIGN